MPDREQRRKEALLESEVRGMKLEEGGSPAGNTLSVKSEPSDNHTPPSDSDRSLRSGSKKSSSHSPMKQERGSASPAEETDVETVGGDITVKVEPGKAPKLSRATSQKVVSRPPQLFQDEPDMTAEATSSFEVITSCIYGAKYLGTTEHALECDCAEEWDPDTKTNYACGEDSDCINRATKMECIGECGCGTKCQNQRFIRKQYANVTVFKTDKKGYGLRADSDLRPDDFIFEYIGEVINEPQFRRRMIQYDEENIKHFYFMSLSKGEFVDATKKGNLGRFCNHSCNPNCYVDKWVVGDKLRMGIFAERNIKAGEELVFNYNVDRYGANPQPCYCGEPNCTGFIGGKTQTERATKLSNTTIEALGIDDGDGWDVAVAKKPKRPRKTGEDDEEYVSNIQPKSLDEGGVTKVMATLMQCKEKWIAVKLLSRIQRCEDEKVRNRVVKMHGYTILKTALATWMDDFNVVLQVLDVLDKMPRITRNKIQDSKIEETVEKLTSCGDERVETKAAELLKIWSKLEVGYRIPRMKRDPAIVAAARKRQVEEDRRAREHARSRSRSKSVEPPRGPSAPSGPKSSMPQRNQSGFFTGPRPPFRPRSFNPLPPGWFSAQANGRLYYYNATGETTWTKPTMPATQAPPPPPRPKTNEQKLQEIIDGITQNKTPNRAPGSSAATPKTAEETKPAKKEEKWRSYPAEKQKKLYENTLFPHIKYVMDKYKNKLARDDLKRLAKDLGKKLVNSDFKNKRVEDPTKISSKQAKAMRKHAKDYFDKAVQKKREHDKRKAEKKAQEETASGKAPKPSGADVTMEDVDKDGEVVLSDMEDDDKDTEATPLSENPELKRKREDGEDAPSTPAGDEETTKKLKTEGATPPPPPPPPPPPAEDMSIEQQEEHEGCTGGAAMDNADPLSSGQQPSPTEDSQDGATRNEISETVSPVNGQPSPAQLATPVTNGDDPEKELKAGAHEFTTMKHKRPLSIVGDA